MFRGVLRRLSLEGGLIAGAGLVVAGVALGGAALGGWGASGFGGLVPGEAMRLVIPSMTLVLLGFQCAYGSFFVSVLEIRASR